MNLWAIPDIHGRADLLSKLINKLTLDHGLDLAVDKLIFLGDMIDRGPDSKPVIDAIRAIQALQPNNVIVLGGNHEWLAIDAATKGSNQYVYHWYINGGKATERSFGGQVPDEVIKWMAALPLYHIEDGFFFSHAPVPREEDREHRNKGQSFTRHELTWTYHHPEGLYARTFDSGAIGVCGHVHALRDNNPNPRFYPHYIFADAGCGCADFAPLVAIEVKTRLVVKADPCVTSPDAGLSA